MKAPADASLRRRALDAACSFIVQAPAGSGKTELLTQRFLVLLARVREPEQVLAITFTRKAAQEMRERVLAALTDAEQQLPTRTAHEASTRQLATAALDQGRRRGWELLQNPTRLKVHTIDGFMASLVAAMPWLSRLGPPPAVAPRPEELYRAAAQRVLAGIDAGGGDGEALTTLMYHLGNRGDDLTELLVRFLARRDQWLRQRGRLDPATLRPELEAALHRVVGDGLTGAHAATAAIGDELAALARYAAQNLPLEHPLQALRAAPTLPAARAEELPSWQALADLVLTRSGEWRRPGGVNKTLGFPAGKGEAAAYKQRMQQLLVQCADQEHLLQHWCAVRELPPWRYTDDQWRVLAAVIRVADLALGALWQEMSRGGEVDFAEVALRALGALGDAQGPSELMLALDQRLSHILVDEFQDTSHLQYHLLLRLTEGWEAGDGRSLFLVGDPMQSIYRFREADVGLFLRIWDEGLGPLQLEPLRLSSNFRSDGQLVDWVNDTFRHVFPERPDAGVGAVTYAASVAFQPQQPGSGARLRVFDRFDATLEATEVVAAAREALRIGTVAILGRSRNHLSAILRVLEQGQLSYQGQDLDPLAQRLAVRDVLSLTRALLHPGDRLAWLAVLRAPWCGLALEDLLAVAQHDAALVPEVLAEPQRVEHLSEDGRRRAGRLWRVLGPRLYRGRGRGVREWIENAWLSLGAPAYLRDGEMEDVATVFQLLEDLQRGPDIGPLEQLEVGVQQLFAAPDPAADGSLQVMTIHKAKGLEFDTVLLPGLGRAPRGDSRELLYWAETADERLLLAAPPPRVHGARAAVAEYLRREEQRRTRCEAQRLLYVAATRARRQLLMWGHAPANADGVAMPPGRSLLAHLWPAVAEHVVPQAVPEEAEAAAAGEAGARLLRVPRDWVLPEPSAAVGSVGDGLPPAEENYAPEYDWAGETTRHVGTVVHRLLERVAQDGPEQWDAVRLAATVPALRGQLRQLGVPPAQLEAAAQRCVTALAATLEDTQGRWLLQQRPSARSEWALTGVVAGRRVRGVVDRTFVDADGARWIVDFKTGSHEGGALGTFLANEVERYRPQLVGYAELIRGLEPERALRAALYYPLIPALCEVDLAPGSGP